MKFDFDLLVIGSGSAGFSAAEAARGTGRKIGIVESEKLGGECPHWACVPTKALLRSAKAYLGTRAFSDLGIEASDISLDFSRVMNRRKRIVEGLSGGRMERVAEKLGFDVVQGAATFIDPHTLHVAGREYSAERFIIATGSSTRVPPIPGINETPWLSYRDAVMLHEKPVSMLVLGGGPVGCEMATIFSALGIATTLLANGEQLLEHDEPEIGTIVKEQLEARGVQVILSAEVVRVGKAVSGVELTARVGRELKLLSASHLLLATGKSPNTGGLGCQAAGVTLDRFGTVVVNGELRTSQKHIWAAGDVHGGLLFTHVAHYEGGIAGFNAFAKKPKRYDERVVPHVTFVEPEAAGVGMTERQAKENVGAVVVGVFQIGALGRAYIDGHRTGLVKLVADKKTHRVLGGAVVGERAGEVIHEIALAVYAKLKVEELAEMIHAYPTYCEAVHAAASEVLQNL